MSEQEPQGDLGQQEKASPRGRRSSRTVLLMVLVAMVPTLGVTAAIARYGVRSYVVPARATGAKEMVGTISRSLSAAYERNETLCGPGSPVPATVPAGEAYMPSLAAGEDFQKGSATEGWPCIKFATAGPIYYQYEVRIGGNYKSVARGGYDPGPDGVEVSAEGDLDGDGRTSLIAFIGQLRATTKTIGRSAELYIVDEYE